MAAAIVGGRYPGKIVLTAIRFAAANFAITSEMQDGRFGGDIGDILVRVTSGKLTKSTSARIRTCIVHRNVETVSRYSISKRKAFDFVHPSNICWDTERRTLCHAAAPLSGM
jgi:hypothetical protein